VEITAKKELSFKALTGQVVHMALLPFIDWFLFFCVVFFFKETKGWLEKTTWILDTIKPATRKTSENFLLLVLLPSCTNCPPYKKVDH